jgi:hypothetical protein
MPAIDFPNSPTVNDTFTSGNTTWQYDGVSWSLVQSAQSIATGSVTIDKIDEDVWASDQAIISKQLFS